MCPFLNPSSENLCFLSACKPMCLIFYFSILKQAYLSVKLRNPSKLPYFASIIFKQTALDTGIVLLVSVSKPVFIFL